MEWRYSSRKRPFCTTTSLTQFLLKTFLFPPFHLVCLVFSSLFYNNISYRYILRLINRTRIYNFVTPMFSARVFFRQTRKIFKFFKQNDNKCFFFLPLEFVFPWYRPAYGVKIKTFCVVRICSKIWHLLVDR